MTGEKAYLSVWQLGDELSWRNAVDNNPKRKPITVWNLETCEKMFEGQSWKECLPEDLRIDDDSDDYEVNRALLLMLTCPLFLYNAVARR